MAKRGKAFGWTPEQDMIVFGGGSVEGRTAQQNCDRRYKLRKFYATSTARIGQTFLKRLAILQSMGKAPKGCDKAFIDKLQRVVKVIAK
ncbi:MAG: hypothetical protein J6S81_08450 [Treponema sp.]|nr:hypothetical protein [Treponema sp.]